MIIRIEDIQSCCSNILNAVDNNSLSVLTETLELIVKDKVLYMNVTNKEYYVQVKLGLSEDADFHATVNAVLFLKLISQITTETVELSCDDTTLYVKGNGNYKLPLIFDNDKLLELPVIEINNVTQTFDIESEILHSILTNNSKQLGIGTVSRPVQKLYYVDDQGCITFTSGACVNNFKLPATVKILLNDKLVKLFKLFKGKSVKFTLGYDTVSEEIIQTKVKFEDSSIAITAILYCDDRLISSVPVTAIRNRATGVYPYSVVLNKNELLETIKRLLLFSDARTKILYSDFEFSNESVTIYDTDKNNKEVILYENRVETINDKYGALLDLNDLKTTLETINDTYINVSFGNSQAVVISRKTVYNVLPECTIS